MLFQSNKNNSASKAGIGYTIGNVLIRGLSFLTLPIFTRLMSTADFGLYTTYISYEGLLCIIVGMGLYVSLKAAKVDYQEKIDHYVSVVSCIPLLFSIFLIGILIPFNSLISSLTGFKWIVIVLMVGQAWASSALMMYNARIGLDYAYKSYITVSIISTISNIVLSLVFILLITPNQPFMGRILGTSIPIICIGLVLTIVFFRRSKPSFDKKTITYGLKYSLPLVPHGLSQQVLAHFGKIIIQIKIGNDLAGIYGFAYTITLIPHIIVTSLDAAWGPWFFEKYAENKTDLIKSKTAQYVALFSAVTVCLLCVSPEVVQIMGDVSYAPAKYIVCPALLSVFFIFLYGIPVQIEYYYKKTKYIAIGTMIAALLNLLSCLALVKRFGYEGIVYITVATYVLYFFAHILIAQKITQNKLPFSTNNIIIYMTIVCSVMGISQLFIELIVVRWSIMIIVIAIMGYHNRNAIKDFFNGEAISVNKDI